ncbi:MAG TPA: glycerophosphodiester phosphodiesterase [Patescibacteria group bacterium]|nr:glycerophosphodiester phosphodiesterase [Patescibacteria group bacterium]
MTKVIAHRGARGLAPENTLVAITAGLNAHADEIEIDIRVTKDGVPILGHSPFMHDNRGYSLRHVLIARQNLAELKSRNSDLATLEDAIRAVDRRVPMVLEVKPAVDVLPVIKVVTHFLKKGWHPKDFLFASFSQRTLEALHEALPQIEPVVNARVSGLWAARRARLVGAKRIAMFQYVVWWGYISAVHHAGYHLVVYTLNNPRKAARWAKRGLYGVVTDYPTRFKIKQR